MWKSGSAVAAAIALLAILPVSPAQAQATRTWVSGVGDDANPCSRTAPCKTFAGAISKTAAGGEISVLDPGGFGGVTINKSLSIVAEGAEGGVLVSGTNAIVVNAAATDVVHLRGLIIEGLGNSLSGVRVLAAKHVVVERSLIKNFVNTSSTPHGGISVVPAAGTVQVTVLDSTITHNVNGVNVVPTATGIATVVLNRTHVINNTAIGVHGVSANARIRVGNSEITGNGTGLQAESGASIVSMGTSNLNCCNTANGAFTTTVPFQ